VLEDGSIMLQGFSNGVGLTAPQGHLLKFDTNGLLDESFGDSGIYSVEVESLNFSNSMHVLDNGKMVLTGMSTTAEDASIFEMDNIMIQHLLPNGTPDVSFNGNGHLTANVFDNDSFQGFSISPQTNNSVMEENGKIILSGQSYEGLQKIGLGLRRHNMDGTLDETFGTNGEVKVFIDNTSINSPFVGLDPSGNIIQVGLTRDANLIFDLVFVRYLSGTVGTLDFGSASNSVLVFPNPIDSEFQLEFELEEAKDLSITLNSIDGKLIKTFYSNQPFAAIEHDLNLSLPTELPTGNYVITLESEGLPIPIQIIKN